MRGAGDAVQRNRFHAGLLSGGVSIPFTEA
jgi:hypothetical protein